MGKVLTQDIGEMLVHAFNLFIITFNYGKNSNIDVFIINHASFPLFKSIDYYRLSLMPVSGASLHIIEAVISSSNKVITVYICHCKLAVSQHDFLQRGFQQSAPGLVATPLAFISTLEIY